MRTHLMIPAALLLLRHPLFAQVPTHTPFAPTAFGGVSVPTGSSRNEFDAGFTVGAAVDYRADRMSAVGLRGEGGFARLPSKGLSGTGITARGTIMGANVNAVLWSPPSPGRANLPYATGGIGVSRLNVTADGAGRHFSVSENRLAFNVGFGMDLLLVTIPARIDARVRPLKASDGTSFTTVAITFGVRF